MIGGVKIESARGDRREQGRGCNGIWELKCLVGQGGTSKAFGHDLRLRYYYYYYYY